MQYTTNQNLKKPQGTDHVNIEDINYNSDKLDSLIPSAASSTNQLVVPTGYYDTLAVGLADNLIDRKGTGESRTFTFDTAYGTGSLGDDSTAIVQSIHGNTLVFNQLFDIASFSTGTTSGVTFTKSGNTITINGTSTNAIYKKIELDAFVNGHKYAFLGQGYASGSCYISDQSGTAAFTGRLYTDNIYVAQNNAGSLRLTIPNGRTFENYLIEINVINLTSMFGAGNEPSTVAEFKKLFPLDYYAYNVGELISYNGTGIKTIEFNQYNPTTGTAVLIGGNQYQITGTYTSVSYSTGETITIASDGTFTPTNNGTLTVVGGNSTDTCVHFTWSGYRNGEFEAYEANTLSLPISTYFSNGMRSAGSVYDELTASKAITRIGSQTITGAIGDTITLTGCSTSATDYLCAKGNIGTLASGVLTLTVAVTGIVVLFVLATPTEVTISPALDLTYPVSDFGTEQSLPENDDEPTTSPFVGVVKYSEDFTRDVVNLPKNYDSTDGLDALCTALATALGTALNGTFTITRGAYNATTRKYAWTCTFTANT